MDQVLQDLRRGGIASHVVPPPRPGPGDVLVHNRYSLISAGTERAKVETGQKSLLGKALERPDHVRQVLQKIRQDGVWAAWRKVRDRLDTPSPLGYSSAGVVVECGIDVKDVKPGDRVACAGAQSAFHAEFIAVPRNLCARIPPQVSFSAASTATVGAIALQGLRQADVRLGENVVVIGLGLLGQLSVQLLKAAGCRVYGIDLDLRKIDTAKKFGLDAGSLWNEGGALDAIGRFTDGFGADVVLLTAASSAGELAAFAGEACRDRGRVVVVGQVPMQLPRGPFYEKELSVYYSRSYGPGRYDAAYEEAGVDYPIGYVRWTENRNMEAYLEQIESAKVAPEALLTHRFSVQDAPKAYELVAQPGSQFVVGVLLEYPEASATVPTILRLSEAPISSRKGQQRIGVIGAGSFATSSLLPHLKKNPSVQFTTICTQHGHTAKHAAKTWGFAACTTRADDVLDDPTVDGVLIASRHDTHGSLVARALVNGKAVFVEKPLCLTQLELADIVRAQTSSGKIVQVGFNRRFSPLAQELFRVFKTRPGPRTLLYRINAGALPVGHWLNDLKIGGGRIRGEVCHFLDFSLAWVGRTLLSVHASSTGGAASEDVHITLSFDDGSMARIDYVVSGSSRMPKERIEVFASGASAVLENFSKLTFYGIEGNRVQRSWTVQKGYKQEMDAWVNSLQGKTAPALPFEQAVYTTQTVEAVLRSLSQGRTVPFTLTSNE